jgi:hypothetical protein
VPDALHKRDMIFGASGLAAIGALLCSLSPARPVVRWFGVVLLAGVCLWGVSVFPFGW